MFALAGHPQYNSKGSFKLFSAFTLGSLISGQEGGGAEGCAHPLLDSFRKRCIYNFCYYLEGILKLFWSYYFGIYELESF